jgi:hypothetical protein
MTRARVTLQLGLLLAILAPAGCATRYGELHGVTVEDRTASAAEVAELEFVREGEDQTARLGMSIQKADELTTPAGLRALLFLNAGFEVVLDSGTVIAIENPSIRVRVGRVFAKVVGTVREALTIHSQFSTATIRGTEVIVAVDPDSTVTIRVLEGRVTAESTSGRYPPVEYGPREGGTFRRDQPPQRMPAIDAAEARRLTQWVRDIERLTVVSVPGVQGRTEQEARTALESLGFRVVVLTGSITGQPAGTVVSQSPSAGDPQRPGATVIVTLEPESVPVPELVGLPRSQAEESLRDAGLRPRITVLPPDSATVVTTRMARVAQVEVVLETDPPAGRRVALRSDVKVTVALRTTVPMCTMPSVIRRDEKTARSLLEEARLRDIRVERGTGNTITFQSVDPGKSVACTTPITIRVGTIIR